MECYSLVKIMVVVIVTPRDNSPITAKTIPTISIARGEGPAE